jgi:hypothetical protein
VYRVSEFRSPVTEVEPPSRAPGIKVVA